MENRITVVSIVTVYLTQFNEKLVRTKWFENESDGVMLLQSQTNHENKIEEFPQKKALAFLEFTRCCPIIKQLHGILSLSFLEWPDKAFLVSTKPGDLSYCMVSDPKLPRFNSYILFGDRWWYHRYCQCIDCYNQWRKKIFNDIFKKRKNS